MKGDRAIARPYAEAAFSHALEKGAVEAWESGLDLLAGLLEAESYADALHRPGVTHHQLLSLTLSALGDQIDGDFAGFVRILAENGRLEQAAAVRDRFLELKLEQERILKVTIHTAFPMSDSQLKSLEETLSVKYGAERRLEFDVQVEPGLIGGVRIQMGDDVIDMSMRSQIDRLANSIRH